MQRFVDRRFYRSRYDAVDTVDAFANRLCDNMDLPQLQAELTEVVAHTLQPVSVGVWIKDRLG